MSKSSSSTRVLFSAANVRNQTLEQVRSNLATRARVMSFAVGAQGLSPDALEEAFQREFG